MKKYIIEYKIPTLAENAVMENTDSPATFSIDGIEFSQWDFNHRDGWLGDSWIGKLTIEAGDKLEAINIFVSKLKKIIPRLSLISQCYIEFLDQPFLITKNNGTTGFFRYIKKRKGVGLSFREEEKNALAHLLKNDFISEEFYYYWNDAVNTIGYSAKLLLIFAAIESLVKNKKGGKDFNLMEKILGKELCDELFSPNTGLRHRLTHGEYFELGDSKIDYLDRIHKKVMGYFNKSVLNQSLLSENVKHPQRHFFGNKEEARFFIERIDGKKLNFREVLIDFSENDFHELKQHKHVSEEEPESTF